MDRFTARPAYAGPRASPTDNTGCRVRRFVCRLFGHQWGEWGLVDVVVEERGCLRCFGVEVRVVQFFGQRLRTEAERQTGPSPMIKGIDLGPHF